MSLAAVGILVRSLLLVAAGRLTGRVAAGLRLLTSTRGFFAEVGGCNARCVVAAASGLERAREHGGRQRRFPRTAGHDTPRLEDQHMAENGHDFFNMMCDQHQGGRVFAAGQTLQELQEMFARRRVQPAQGSSRISSGGRAIRARPISKRCRSPWERKSHGRSASAPHSIRPSRRKPRRRLAAVIAPQKAIMASRPLTMVSRAGSPSGILWRTAELTKPTRLRNSAPVGRAINLATAVRSGRRRA